MKYIFFIFLLAQNLFAAEFSALDFEQTRSHFLLTYQPIVKTETGLNLKLELNTDIPNYFGGMSVKDDIMSVLLGSELDRDAGMTPDAYAFILCHEVGHLLGGLPKKITRGEGSKYSSEGQSDYFGASVCLKKLFSLESDKTSTTPIQISAAMNERCEKKYETEIDRLVCKRIVNAGRELFHYIHMIYLTYNLDMPEPDMDVPEAEGQSMGHEYPTFQCRMDTIAAGALSLERPACWYRP